MWLTPLSLSGPCRTPAPAESKTRTPLPSPSLIDDRDSPQWWETNPTTRLPDAAQPGSCPAEPPVRDPGEPLRCAASVLRRGPRPLRWAIASATPTSRERNTTVDHISNPIPPSTSKQIPRPNSQRVIDPLCLGVRFIGWTDRVRPSRFGKPSPSGFPPHRRE